MKSTKEYSVDFMELISEISKEKRDWPNYSSYITDSLGGAESRYYRFSTETVPEIEAHCGSLQQKTVLDFGCGSGATTAALAEARARVTAFDIDESRVDLCRRRCQEHGVQDAVTCVAAASFDDVVAELGQFDVVVMNGVIEHIPHSIDGLRAKILQQVFGVVRPGGYLFVNDTPNRLCPIDFHTTQLWWIPWSRPGSQWAYRRAVQRGRFVDSPSCSCAIGLEEAGAWGATYWEVRRHLGRGARCVNLLRDHSRRIRYKPMRKNRKRDLFEAFMSVVGVRLLRAPLTAFTPDLTNLVFSKRK